jgi:hypothetical protein
VPDHEDELIERIAAELRAPVRVDPSFDARVMTEIASLPPVARHEGGGVRAIAGWLARPRTLTVSPLGGLALAAALAALFLWLRPAQPLAPSPAASAPGVLVARHGPLAVQFVLVAPDARSVALVGDFNDWDAAATPLRATATGGAWSVAVRLPPGRHRYAFVIDGTRWVADPAAPPAPDDDFGSPGSVVTVGA